VRYFIASDQHPNIVRWYGAEIDPDFVYVALEHCNCSLSDSVMTLDSSKSVWDDMHAKNEATNALQMKKIKQVSSLCEKVNINLWTDDERASQQLLRLMRDLIIRLMT